MSCFVLSDRDRTAPGSVYRRYRPPHTHTHTPPRPPKRSNARQTLLFCTRNAQNRHTCTVYVDINRPNVRFEAARAQTATVPDINRPAVPSSSSVRNFRVCHVTPTRSYSEHDVYIKFVTSLERIWRHVRNDSWPRRPPL